jgi:YD repeat-containing protein
VFFSLTGTATPPTDSGYDYTVNSGGAIIGPDDGAGGNIVLSVFNDNYTQYTGDYSEWETAIVTLLPGPGYTVGPDDSATVWILNDDPDERYKMGIVETPQVCPTCNSSQSSPATVSNPTPPPNTATYVEGIMRNCACTGLANFVIPGSGMFLSKGFTDSLAVFEKILDPGSSESNALKLTVERVAELGNKSVTHIDPTKVDEYDSTDPTINKFALELPEPTNAETGFQTTKITTTQTWDVAGTSHEVEREHFARIPTIDRTAGELGDGFFVQGIDRMIAFDEYHEPSTSPFIQEVLFAKGYTWFQPNGSMLFFEQDFTRNYQGDVIYSNPPTYSAADGDLSFAELTVENGQLTLTKNNAEVLTFDSSTSMIQTRADRNGNTFQYSYDDHNGDGKAQEVETIIDPRGRVTTYNYLGGPKVKRITVNVASMATGEGFIVDLVHSGGNLTQVIEQDPDGAGPLASSITVFGYNSDNITSWTTPEGELTTLSYNDRDSLTSYTTPAGGTYTVESYWDEMWEVYKAGVDTPTASFDLYEEPDYSPGDSIPAGHLVGTITHPGPGSRVTTMQFDKYSRPVVVTTPDGTETRTNRGGINGLATGVSVYDTSGTGDVYTTSYTFNSKGHQTSMTEPNGAIHTWVPQLSTGLPLEYTDPLDVKTEFTRDADGNATKIVVIAGGGGATVPGGTGGGPGGPGGVTPGGGGTIGGSPDDLEPIRKANYVVSLYLNCGCVPSGDSRRSMRPIDAIFTIAALDSALCS